MLSETKRFFHLSVRKRLVLTEAIVLMVIAKTILLLMPVKAIMKMSFKTKKTQTDPDISLLKDIQWAISRADRLSFWKNRCIVQSIAGRWMLQRRGIDSQIIFGIKHDENLAVIAHAWLKTGDFEIVMSGRNYRELMKY